jgi:hypothetical protein
MSRLPPGQTKDALQDTTTNELGLDELAKATGGACAASSHFQQVGLGMRKSGGKD